MGEIGIDYFGTTDGFPPLVRICNSDHLYCQIMAQIANLRQHWASSGEATELN